MEQDNEEDEEMVSEEGDNNLTKTISPRKKKMTTAIQKKTNLISLK